MKTRSGNRMLSLFKNNKTSHWKRWFFLLMLISLILSSCMTPEANTSTDLLNAIYIESEQPQIPGSSEKNTKQILDNYNTDANYRELTIKYPFNQSIFPPEIAAPTFKWAEMDKAVDTWLLIISFNKNHNSLYTYSGKSDWTPNKEIWKLIKQNSTDGPAKLTILGINSTRINEIVSKGTLNISTSPDPVGAPIMFRRVFPNFAYAARHPGQMEWVLADISSYDEPSVIMSNQPMCAGCHTFSQNGSVFGMDMDYNKDKGSYLFSSVREDIELKGQDFISWNDFPRTDGLQSTGLYSRISPDGSHIASTVNEILFLIKISNPYFSQLFFPLQGSLAIYSNITKKVTTLPGADFKEIVQTDPSWSPDGNHLLFSRAPSKMDLFWELGGQTVFSVEDADIDQLNYKYPIKFDIYRIPFNNGKGGIAKPLPGASNNGKSNYYPRYSPDGKWIVFTQSETGLAIQQDSKLIIMPASGGKTRLMRANLRRLNSWHTWSPNSKWLAFVSKENTPFTELFLTHIDEQGNDSPPVLLSRLSKPGYAINVPEFANISPLAIKRMTVKNKE